MCPWLYFLCIRPHKSLQTSLDAQHAAGNFPWRVLGSDPADQHGIRPPQVLPTQTLGISEIPDEDELLLFEWWTLLYLSWAADRDSGSYGSGTSALVEKPLWASSDTVSMFHLWLCSLSISCKQFNVPSRLVLADTNRLSESTECWASYQKKYCMSQLMFCHIFLKISHLRSSCITRSRRADRRVFKPLRQWEWQCWLTVLSTTNQGVWVVCLWNKHSWKVKNRVQNNLRDQNILSHPGGWR